MGMLELVVRSRLGRGGINRTSSSLVTHKILCLYFKVLSVYFIVLLPPFSYNDYKLELAKPCLDILLCSFRFYFFFLHSYLSARFFFLVFL